MIARLRALVAEGLSYTTIGERLGVSKNTVSGKVHRLKLEGHVHRISEETKAAVRAAAEAGESRRSIAIRLDISRGSISELLRGTGVRIARPHRSTLPHRVAPLRFSADCGDGRGCQCIVSRAGEAVRFCDAPIEGRGSWCEEHRRQFVVHRSHQPAQAEA